MVIELLIAILILFLVYFEASYDRRKHIDEMSTRIIRCMRECGLEPINQLSKEHRVTMNKMLRSTQDLNSCFRIILHFYCHSVEEKHGGIFDRIEEKVINKCVSRGYYLKDSDPLFTYCCSV